jgi:molybdopterin-binding protein
MAIDPGLPPNVTDVLVCIRAEDVLLTPLGDHLSSARNSFPATVQALIQEGAIFRVSLDCGFPLVALLTKPGCEALRLREGTRVAALFKASGVHIIPHAALQRK